MKKDAKLERREALKGILGATGVVAGASIVGCEQPGGIQEPLGGVPALAAGDPDDTCSCSEVSVLDFEGVDPTGTTDSTDGIQDAIDSLPDGGIVRLPPGRFLISSTIMLYSGISLVGSGFGADWSPVGVGKNDAGEVVDYTDTPVTELVWTGAAGTLVELEDAAHNICVENLRINGLRAAGTIGLKTVSSMQCAFRNLTVQNCQTHILRTVGVGDNNDGNSAWNFFENIYIIGGKNGDDGLVLEGNGSGKRVTLDTYVHLTIRNVSGHGIKFARDCDNNNFFYTVIQSGSVEPGSQTFVGVEYNSLRHELNDEGEEVLHTDVYENNFFALSIDASDGYGMIVNSQGARTSVISALKITDTGLGKEGRVVTKLTFQDGGRLIFNRTTGQVACSYFDGLKTRDFVQQEVNLSLQGVTTLDSDALFESNYLYRRILPHETVNFEVTLFYRCVATSGIKVGFKIPEGAEVIWSAENGIYMDETGNITNSKLVIQNCEEPVDPDHTLTFYGSQSGKTLKISGRLRNYREIDDLRVLWAQGSSENTALTVFEGSSLRVFRSHVQDF